MFFRQVKHRGDNFSYIIADEAKKEAIVVDPSFNVEALLRIIKDHGLRVLYIVNTHSHVDHTAGNEPLKTATGAKLVVHESAKAKQDVTVADGDILKVGDISVKVLHTPGHSQDSICLLAENKLLTGDTLFVGECGRTDLAGGDAEAMYYSLERLKKFDDKIEVYPGHDYGIKPFSTIGEEKKTNYTLKNRTLEEFLEFMGIP
ncbi:MAG: MBL fold metallo-hydrolase [Candidatus Bathyarchaeia archaeon]